MDNRTLVYLRTIFAMIIIFLCGYKKSFAIADLKSAIIPPLCKAPLSTLSSTCQQEITNKCPSAYMEQGNILITKECFDHIQEYCRPTTCLVDIPEDTPQSTHAAMQELNKRSEQLGTAIQEGNVNQLRVIQASTQELSEDALKAQLRAEQQVAENQVALPGAQPPARLMMRAALVAAPGIAEVSKKPTLSCLKAGKLWQIPITNGTITGDDAGLVQESNGTAVDLSNCRFSLSTQPRITDIKFEGTSKAKLKLTGAIFSLGILTHVSFVHCHMVGAQFLTAQLNNVLFTWTNLFNSAFTFATITDGQPAGGSHASFYGVIANNSNFAFTKFNNTSLRLINLSHADFINSTWNASAINLYSDLSAASFVNTKGSSLQIGSTNNYVDATWASFIGSTITNISFTGLHAFPTILKDVDFKNTSFGQSSFKNVQVGSTCILESPNLEKVKMGDGACQ